MSDKQITPVEALTVIVDTMKNIPIDATLHVNCYVLDALSKINETAKAGLQAASQPTPGMPSLDKPILTDEDVRAWEESETSRPPAGFEKIPFDPNRLKQMEGHEQRAEKSWEEIQKRLSQPPAVKGEVWFYCWKDDPKSNGQYFVETNMGRKVVANYNKEAKWCPQDFPMWTDGERPYKFQDDESPTAAGDGKEDDETNLIERVLQRWAGKSEVIHTGNGDFEIIVRKKRG